MFVDSSSPAKPITHHQLISLQSRANTYPIPHAIAISFLF
jgi:hypothetical protein